MDSIDFFAVARSVLLVGRVKGQENRRAMVQIKNNLAERGHGKSFVLSDGVFCWQGDYDITEDELVGGFSLKSSKQEDAKSCFLVSVISIERCRHQIFGKRHRKKHRKKESLGEPWS